MSHATYVRKYSLAIPLSTLPREDKRPTVRQYVDCWQTAFERGNPFLQACRIVPKYVELVPFYKEHEGPTFLPCEEDQLVHKVGKIIEDCLDTKILQEGFDLYFCGGDVVSKGWRRTLYCAYANAPSWSGVLETLAERFCFHLLENEYYKVHGVKLHSTFPRKILPLKMPLYDSFLVPGEEERRHHAEQLENILSFPLPDEMFGWQTVSALCLVNDKGSILARYSCYRDRVFNLNTGTWA